jgi:hypothetical protein
MKNICTSLLRSALIPCLLVIGGLGSVNTHAETNPRFYAVEVSATVQPSPAQITLRWTSDVNAAGYNIYRKAPSATSWSHITSLGASATTWTDSNVANGSSYEYAITKSTTLGYQGTGYVLAGINAPMTENRGKMVLIVDNTHAAALATELTRLQQDLVGDGWTVIRHDVSRSATPPQVKDLIKNTYNADPANVKSVFIFGHVAVPYSGNYTVDGHDDHRGAWTADSYYGDVDGTWTDSSVHNTSAHKPWNHNTPGDGKFDQSDIPSDIELAVGRVDLYNMTCYSNKAWSRSELDLLRAYLNKDHNFRHGRIVVPRRGLVCDNFGEIEGEAFASTGWRSFAPFFGGENNVQVPYGQFFSTLRDNGYLWSYGTGGGSWYTCNGVGGSDDFANTEIKTVFTAFLGSYFGDWDNESAFLRAPLGSGYALASAWGGRPHWFFHPMGLGETIGTATKLSQNNRYGGLYGGQNWGTRQVHVSLHGDPSLRMHAVIPPGSVAISGSSVTWTASTDTAIQGYNVYRASFANGPFTKISGSSPISSLLFTDSAGTAGNVYMVRAVKLEQSGSGTYLNLSQGILSGTGSVTTNPTPTPTPTAPAAPSNMSGSAQSTSSIRVQWADNSSNENGFRVLRKAGASGTYTTLTIGANTTSYTDTGLSAGTQYFYKVHAYNAVGNSADSGEISVTTQAASTPTPPTTAAGSATFVRTDTATGGTWKGSYGAGGGLDPNNSVAIPPASATITPSHSASWTWAFSTQAAAALQKATGTDRIAHCWYASDYLEFVLEFSDTAAHRVSFYFLDYDRAGREQKVELYDYGTGQLLNSASVANFSGGAYSTWDLKGKLRVRVSRVAGANAVVSAVFIDPVSVSTTPTSPTTPPTATSVFLSRDTVTRGSWKGTYGREGFIIPNDGQSLPSHIVATAPLTSYTWATSTTDTRTLQKGSSSTGDRLASCWYTAGVLEYQVSFADGLSHKLSLYFLDYGIVGRQQSVQIVDRATGAILDTQVLSDFKDGVWLNYSVKGQVAVRVTRTAGVNTLLTGVFIDPLSTTTTPTPEPTPGPANAVRFLNANTSTGGTWKGQYGVQGVHLAGEAARLPNYATVSFAGKADHVWNWSTTDSAALQKSLATDRLAACWYAGGSFDVRVNLTDGQTHKVSFYALDWDMQNRAQRVEVLDTTTGAVLHTQNLSGFQRGAYLSYDVKGNVTFRFVRTGPYNSVVSGMFFDAPSAAL